MISEMREHLQMGFGLLESIWSRCFGNRELAHAIFGDHEEEFEELEVATEKAREIVADIRGLGAFGTSFIDSNTTRKSRSTFDRLDTGTLDTYIINNT